LHAPTLIESWVVLRTKHSLNPLRQRLTSPPVPGMGTRGQSPPLGAVAMQPPQLMRISEFVIRAGSGATHWRGVWRCSKGGDDWPEVRPTTIMRRVSRRELSLFDSRMAVETASRELEASGTEQCPRRL
jgi:hypothetical protein